MKKLAEVTAVSFSVKLTEPQFLALDKRNDYNNSNDSRFNLISILQDVTNAESIDFDGHFGAAVFFTLGADCLDDAEVIAKIIKMYANKKSYLSMLDASRASKYSKKENTGFISAFEYALGENKF